MSTPIWCITEQQKRREALHATYVPLGKTYFNERGEFVAAGEEPRLRERLWHCLGLYAGDEQVRKLAKIVWHVLTQARPYRPGNPKFPGSARQTRGGQRS